MPAYFDTGFSVRQPMWHGEGIVLGEYPEDWADARTKAGLLWEPIEHPSWVRRDAADFVTCRQCDAKIGEPHGDSECDAMPHGFPIVMVDHCEPLASVHVTDGSLFVPDWDHKQVIRSDTKAVLGVGRSADYTLIQHGADENVASMEQILDAFKDANGKIKFETAGAAKGGAEVWALIYLDEPYQIKGDPSQTIPFIALLNRHDGGGSCRLTRTQVRVVCWNTFQMAWAEGDATGLQFTFRHTASVGDRIEEAKAALEGVRADTAEYVEMCNDLATLKVDDAHLAKFITDFLPNPGEHGEIVSDRVKGNVDKAREMFRHIYLDSTTTEGVRGTGYGLFQAGTEYLDHARAYRSRDSYMGRSILKGDAAKGRLLQLVRGAA